jgi:hypothetical protein
MKSRRRSLAILSLSLLSTASGVAYAELPFLLELRSDPVRVLYTPGSLDRAYRVQQRFTLLAEDFGKWNGGLVPLSIVLLTREEWVAAGAESLFGLPAQLPDSQLALSAWGDSGTVGLWRALAGGSLPTLEGVPIRGTPEEASSLVGCDWLGQVEASRLLLAAAGYGAAKPWVREVMAHTVALAVLARYESQSLSDVVALYSSFARPDEARFGPGSREAGSREAALQSWLRSEARFFEAARILVSSRGPRVAKDLLKLARKRKGQLEGDEVLDRFPQLSDWQSSL